MIYICIYSAYKDDLYVRRVSGETMPRQAVAHAPSGTGTYRHIHIYISILQVHTFNLYYLYIYIYISIYLYISGQPELRHALNEALLSHLPFWGPSEAFFVIQVNVRRVNPNEAFDFRVKGSG